MLTKNGLLGQKAVEDVELAIKMMVELEKGNPAHPDASRTAKSWEALRSMSRRTQKVDGGDYRDQLASDAGARRNEVLSRIIRTAEDAKEVLAFIDQDLKENPKEKTLWQKKGTFTVELGSSTRQSMPLRKRKKLMNTIL